MDDADIHRTAVELRLVLGRLVRTARTKDPMPPATAGVLGYLDREGPKTTSELAVLYGVRQQSMARTVAHLIDAGWAEPRPHPTDGRKLLLHLTEPGRAALEERRSHRIEWLQEAIATRLTEEEQRTVADSVALLARLAETR